MIDKGIKYICQLTIVICICLCGGCPGHPEPQISPAELRASAYRAVTGQFEQAALIKPKENSAPADVFALAPLIVEDRSQRRGPNSSYIGDSPRSLPGVERNITSVVYYDQTLTTLRGNPYRQLYLVWFYIEKVGSKDTQSAIRLTLDSRGFPMIAEVFESGSVLLKIFVSKSLEEAARKQYATPLPNRRYVIESSAETWPRIIVPRVLEDGPQPMGPYVYLDDQLDIVTLLCRCSPSQVRDFTENTYYDLSPIKTIRDRHATLPLLPTDIQPAFPETDDPGWLEKALRLPAELP